jgi:tetratricopeptide (TPR) repeat protein
VDDHADPFRELARLVTMGVVNDLWNQGWTAFMEKRFAEALKRQEQATARAEEQPAMLPEVVYDLAVIRLAAGDRPGALSAVRRALKLNPKLGAQAKVDPDLEAIRAELP